MKRRLSCLSVMRPQTILWVSCICISPLTLTARSTGGDSLRVLELVKKSSFELKNNNLPQALDYAIDGLDLAEKNSSVWGKAYTLHLLGDIALKKRDMNAALGYYIQSVKNYEQIRDNKDALATIYNQIAFIYEEWRAYEKANDYFRRALSYLEPAEQASNLRVVSNNYAQIDKFSEAALYAQKELDIIRSIGDRKTQINTLQRIIDLMLKAGQYEKTITYCQELQSQYERTNDNNGKANVLNTLGLLYQRMNKPSQAINHFRLAKSYTNERHYTTFQPILLNLGFAYITTQEYDKAIENLQDAVKLSERQNDKVGIARGNNYLALAYVASGKRVEPTIKLVGQSEDLALEVGARDLLLETYKLLAELNNKVGQRNAYNKYIRLYSALKNEIENERKNRQTEVLRTQIDIEKKENELRTIIADKERQNLTLRQSTLESEKKERDLAFKLKQNELMLLKQKQELQETALRKQQLEQERIRHALLTEQLEKAKKDNEIRELQRESEMQELAVKEQELEREKQAQHIKANEAQAKVLKTKIEAEKKRTQYGMYGLIGVVGALGIFAFLFLQKRKDAKHLAKQKKDIEEKNQQLQANEEELRQNTEELQSVNEHLNNAQKELHLKLAEIQAKEEAIRKSAEELQVMNNNLSKARVEVEQRNSLLQANEQELKKTIKRMEDLQTEVIQTEKMASLGQLVAGVAHEINTPIGISLSVASNLSHISNVFKDKLDNATLKKNDLLEYVHDSVETSQLLLANLQRAAELIQSFKKVAVNQSAEILQSFNLKDYVNDILRSLLPEFRKNKTTYEVHGGDDIVMTSYASALSQVVINFSMNAMIHAFGGAEGNGGNIIINLSSDGEWATIHFSDNGAGIPPENLSKIFDPFFTTRRGAGGSGLGLNIVYNIVTQKLGGKLRVDSEIGKGTTFIMNLPLKLETENIENGHSNGNGHHAENEANQPVTNAETV